MESEGKVKSLQKALSVLECFTRDNPSLGVSEIARMLDMGKSNVHNILSTLEASGYIRKNHESDKYELGYKLLEFSYAVMRSYPYTSVVLPVLKDLATDLNIIVYFGIPHQQSVLYLFSAYPKSYGKHIPYRSILGETAPFYCTSIGKAMLQTMDEAEVRSKAGSQFTKFTEHTLSDVDALLADLKKCRERGYAIDEMEHENGVRCVGVPVLNRDGNLIGALSASGPVSVVTEEKTGVISQKLLTASFEIQARI